MMPCNLNGHSECFKSHAFCNFNQLRRTHVQDGEAGGITQQIGATNVPVSCIQEQTKMCKEVLVIFLFEWDISTCTIALQKVEIWCRRKSAAKTPLLYDMYNVSTEQHNFYFSL